MSKIDTFEQVSSRILDKSNAYPRKYEAPQLFFLSGMQVGFKFPVVATEHHTALSGQSGPS